MFASTRSIYCCACCSKVDARLTSGEEIYPHRPDLAHIPFWKCGARGNYVGCHWKTADRTRPLGNIPTREIMAARKHIHAILDPLWKTTKCKPKAKGQRRKVYAEISKRIGKEYHTGEISSLEEAREVYKIVRELGGAEV
jgi:zinc-finger-containing domain